MKALAVLAEEYHFALVRASDMGNDLARRLKQLGEERARNRELALQVQQLTEMVASAQETIRVQEAANHKLRKRIRELESADFDIEPAKFDNPVAQYYWVFEQ